MTNVDQVDQMQQVNQFQKPRDSLASDAQPDSASASASDPRMNLDDESNSNYHTQSQSHSHSHSHSLHNIDEDQQAIQGDESPQPQHDSIQSNSHKSKSGKRRKAATLTRPAKSRRHKQHSSRRGDDDSSQPVTPRTAVDNRLQDTPQGDQPSSSAQQVDRLELDATAKEAAVEYEYYEAQEAQLTASQLAVEKEAHAYRLRRLHRPKHIAKLKQIRHQLLTKSTHSQSQTQSNSNANASALPVRSLRWPLQDARNVHCYEALQIASSASAAPLTSTSDSVSTPLGPTDSSAAASDAPSDNAPQAEPVSATASTPSANSATNSAANAEKRCTASLTARLGGEFHRALMLGSRVQVIDPSHGVPVLGELHRHDATRDLFEIRVRDHSIQVALGKRTQLRQAEEAKAKEANAAKRRQKNGTDAANDDEAMADDDSALRPKLKPSLSSSVSSSIPHYSDEVLENIKLSNFCTGKVSYFWIDCKQQPHIYELIDVVWVKSKSSSHWPAELLQLVNYDSVEKCYVAHTVFPQPRSNAIDFQDPLLACIFLGYDTKQVFYEPMSNVMSWNAGLKRHEKNPLKRLASAVGQGRILYAQLCRKWAKCEDRTRHAEWNNRRQQLIEARRSRALNAPKPAEQIESSSNDQLATPVDASSLPDLDVNAIQSSWLNLRVSCFWSDDAAWYSGTVRSYNAVSGRHFIVYDDGAVEWIDFMQQPVSVRAWDLVLNDTNAAVIEAAASQPLASGASFSDVSAISVAAPSAPAPASAPAAVSVGGPIAQTTSLPGVKLCDPALYVHDFVEFVRDALGREGGVTSMLQRAQDGAATRKLANSSAVVPDPQAPIKQQTQASATDSQSDTGVVATINAQANAAEMPCWECGLSNADAMVQLSSAGGSAREDSSELLSCLRCTKRCHLKCFNLMLQRLQKGLPVGCQVPQLSRLAMTSNAAARQQATQSTPASLLPSGEPLVALCPSTGFTGPNCAPHTNVSYSAPRCPDCIRCEVCQVFDYHHAAPIEASAGPEAAAEPATSLSRPASSLLTCDVCAVRVHRSCLEPAMPGALRVDGGWCCSSCLQCRCCGMTPHAMKKHDKEARIVDLKKEAERAASEIASAAAKLDRAIKRVAKLRLDLQNENSSDANISNATGKARRRSSLAAGQRNAKRKKISDKISAAIDEVEAAKQAKLQAEAAAASAQQKLAQHAAGIASTNVKLEDNGQASGLADETRASSRSNSISVANAPPADPSVDDSAVDLDRTESDRTESDTESKPSAVSKPMSSALVPNSDRSSPNKHHVLLPLADGDPDDADLATCAKFWPAWQYDFTLCPPCSDLMNKRHYCPICLDLWREDEVIPMIECERCVRWVHIACDPNAAQAEAAFLAKNTVKYLCPDCLARGKADEMTHILDVLTKLDKNNYFTQPVSDLLAPDYSTTIKTPMDFATIRQKLERLAYSSIEEFKHDLNLVWRNAKDYNGKTSSIHRFAQTLQSRSMQLFGQLARQREMQKGLQVTQGQLQDEAEKPKSTSNHKSAGDGRSSHAKIEATDLTDLEASNAALVDSEFGDDPMSDQEGVQSDANKRMYLNAVSDMGPLYDLLHTYHALSMHDQLCDADVCASCASHGDSQAMLCCARCSETMHWYCIAPRLVHRLTKDTKTGLCQINAERLSGKWHCANCATCLVCKRAESSHWRDSLLQCASCDAVQHQRCTPADLQPLASDEIAYASVAGGKGSVWRCIDCSVCYSCGARESSDGHWHGDWDLCRSCHDSIHVHKRYCPVCITAWPLGMTPHSWLAKNALQCAKCRLYSHPDCEALSQLDMSVYTQCQDEFFCIMCRETSHLLRNKWNAVREKITRSSAEQSRRTNSEGGLQACFFDMSEVQPARLPQIISADYNIIQQISYKQIHADMRSQPYFVLEQVKNMQKRIQAMRRRRRRVILNQLARVEQESAGMRVQLAAQLSQEASNSSAASAEEQTLSRSMSHLVRTLEAFFPVKPHLVEHLSPQFIQDLTLYRVYDAPPRTAYRAGYEPKCKPTLELHASGANAPRRQDSDTKSVNQSFSAQDANPPHGGDSIQLQPKAEIKVKLEPTEGNSQDSSGSHQSIGLHLNSSRSMECEAKDESALRSHSQSHQHHSSSKSPLGSAANEAMRSADDPDAQSMENNSNDQQHQERIHANGIAHSTSSVAQDANRLQASSDQPQSNSQPHQHKVKHETRAQLVSRAVESHRHAKHGLLLPSAVHSIGADTRTCVLCRRQGDGDPRSPRGPGRLLYAFTLGLLDAYVHIQCALWSAHTRNSMNGLLDGLVIAFLSAQRQNCTVCRKPGATLHCLAQKCPQRMHFDCAIASGARFYEDQRISCSQHTEVRVKAKIYQVVPVERRLVCKGANDIDAATGVQLLLTGIDTSQLVSEKARKFYSQIQGTTVKNPKRNRNKMSVYRPTKHKFAKITQVDSVSSARNEKGQGKAASNQTNKSQQQNSDSDDSDQDDVSTQADRDADSQADYSRHSESKPAEASGAEASRSLEPSSATNRNASDLNSTPSHSLAYVRVGALSLLKIGQLHESEHFHTPHVIYPCGYESCRLFWSYKQFNVRVKYTCTITEIRREINQDNANTTRSTSSDLDQDEDESMRDESESHSHKERYMQSFPQFTIVASDDVNHPIVADTPQLAYSCLVDRFNSSPDSLQRNRLRDIASCRTAEGDLIMYGLNSLHFFGLATPVIAELCEYLPNAHEYCPDYAFECNTRRERSQAFKKRASAANSTLTQSGPGGTNQSTDDSNRSQLRLIAKRQHQLMSQHNANFDASLLPQNANGCARCHPFKGRLDWQTKRRLREQQGIQDMFGSSLQSAQMRAMQRQRAAEVAQQQSSSSGGPGANQAPMNGASAPDSGAASQAGALGDRSLVRRRGAPMDLASLKDLPLSSQYRIMKQSAPRAHVRHSAIHEWGLFASQDLLPGTLVIEYLGELIRQCISDRREVHYENVGLDSCYMFRIDSQEIVDSTRRGNISRYINHSCGFVTITITHTDHA